MSLEPCCKGIGWKWTSGAGGEPGVVESGVPIDGVEQGNPRA